MSNAYATSFGTEQMTENLLEMTMNPPKNRLGSVDAGLELSTQIRPFMYVFDEDDRLCGILDRLDLGTGNMVLSRDIHGRRHVIPLDWVAEVDNAAVYLTMPLDQIKKSWKETPPAMSV